MTSTAQHNVCDVRDPNTLSNYNEFSTIHTTANFTIDFEGKNLIGNVLLKLKPVARTERRELFLDTSYLDIHDVQVDGRSSKWDLMPRSEPYGSALKISLDRAVKDTGSFEIDVSGGIFFTTMNDLIADRSTRLKCRPQKIALLCSGSHQLRRRIGSIHLYVSLTPPFDHISRLSNQVIVSQCQAIHARSVFPCQDTPDVKSTYEFNLRSPLPVIASGLFTGTKDFQPGKGGERGTLLYTFKQDIPIPSYLFAIASG